MDGTKIIAIHEAAANGQHKISALIEVISELKIPLLTARKRGKDVVFVDANEYEFLIDQLLGLAGTLSGDLSNAYGSLTLQVRNSRIHERMEAGQISKLSNDILEMVYAGIRKEKQSRSLTIAR